VSADETALNKLSLVLFSGSYDRVHYALAMAAAALASNRSATLFFTMGAAKALLAADAGGPGWRLLHATEDGIAPLAADASLIEKGVGGFEDLLSACVALGATVMVCEMGLRAMDIEPNRLRQDVTVTSGGLVTFLADASRHGAVVFV
jgi:peroxiredoxin family protein